MNWTMLSDIGLGLSGFMLLGILRSRRPIEAFLNAVLVWLPVLIIPAILLSARVNLFANIWGSHAAWKLALVALIFLLYPPIVYRTVRRIPHRLWKAIGYTNTSLVYFFCVGMVLIDWAAFPHPLEVVPSPELGLDWVALHPTPAIHHAYANATYCGLYIAFVVACRWGKPTTQFLVRVVKSQKIINSLTVSLFVSSLIIRLLS